MDISCSLNLFEQQSNKAYKYARNMRDGSQEGTFWKDLAGFDLAHDFAKKNLERLGASVAHSCCNISNAQTLQTMKSIQSLLPILKKLTSFEDLTKLYVYAVNKMCFMLICVGTWTASNLCRSRKGKNGWSAWHIIHAFQPLQ